MQLSDAKSLGFEADRLARIGAFLDETYIANGRLPGLDVLVARDGEPVYRHTSGKARADGTPMAVDTLCRIASMTKPLTSVAFMMLVEEGKIALDDPVTKVIPEFASLGVYAGGGGEQGFFPARPAPAMRMVDLITHQSGLTYGIQNRTNVDAAYRKGRLDGHASLPGNDHFIEHLAKLPLEFAPGEAWNYSVGTDVLGVIVARLSGMSLGEFFATRIFAPLGMVDTGFHCPDNKAHRLADAFAYQQGGAPLLFDPAEKSGTRRVPQFESGGGGLLSTTADYHRFCRMLVNGGAADGTRLLSPKTLQLMTANHLPGGADLTQVSRALFSEAYNAGAGFGLGFGVTIDPARALVPGSAGEFYWGGIFSTAFFVDPVEKIHAVFMTQLYPSFIYPIRRQLKTLIYSALAESRA
ncbi:MAG: serine hydrolase [Novosphingobium sp. 17-62-19]|uniref:serine hydrolase domain-containing protein n=1 Tax=Novosphingobium sp. 17-62-19 TaxID=1970406 RepID=UPI000BD5A38C|nr:serine hydrolase domain-containing protein [Novosphingobium sp. 17-62-19]OYX95033.1 MAG: serine hydrolase [Novosphingobium sp. 35-62-5]OZA18210.1 MAG: serine hydrolase [Novosphingobium sp. 17-62-19]HQS96113.1 serine hydrolase domain-containing protein [Novosphingobium sp.]